MALTPIQRDLIESTLGVQPRRKGLHIASKSEKTDSKIAGALDDYERREAKVLEAIQELEAVPATGDISADLNMRVSTIRRTMMTTGRDGAPDVIKKAYDDLDAIKDEARDAAKLAKANQDFYESLATADRDHHALENHAQHGFIANQIGTIEGLLQQARGFAKAGTFDSARTKLIEANEASRDAKVAVEKYDRDLKAFNLRATPVADKSTALDNHPQKPAATAKLGEADTKLQSARSEATAGRFTEADKLLDEADQAHANAKIVADNAFLALVIAAEQDRDGIRTHADPAVVKMFAGDLGPVDTFLQTARSGYPDALDKADPALKSAQQALGINKGKVDQAVTDLKKLRDDADAIDVRIKELDPNPLKYKVDKEFQTATDQLKTARTETEEGHIDPARTALTEADKACKEAKDAIILAFTAMIDDAAKDLAPLRTHDDPAVVKAMTAEIALIDAQLQTARDNMVTDFPKADTALGQATQAILFAATHRDEAATDIGKLREAAKKTDAALKLMEAHPQKLHVKPEIDIAIARLASSRTETEEGRITEAKRLQGEADTNAAAGKGFADKFAAFLVTYADGTRYTNGLAKIMGTKPEVKPTLDTAKLDLTAAKDKASTQRKYDEAAIDVTNAVKPLRDMKDQLKTLCMEVKVSATETRNYATEYQDLENKLATIVPPDQTQNPGVEASALKKLDADKNAVLVAEMKELGKLKDRMDANAEAGNWHEVSADRILFHKMISVVKKVAARREAYNTERAETLTEIQKLKTHKSLIGHMMSLQNLVIRADRLATSKDMRFEDAREQLADIRNTCTLLGDVGKAADTYLTERSEADTVLEELDKLKAA